MTPKMKIKNIIQALRNINGKRLATASGITLALAFFIATICFIGKHAPAVLLILAGAAVIVFFYYLLTMLEE